MAQARASWRTDPEAGVGGIAPDRLVFLDECGIATNMARTHGRAPRGRRAIGTVPCARKHVSILGAIGLQGFVGVMSLQGATDGAAFASYLGEVLIPALRRHKPDAVLVMDNLRAHKTPLVRALLASANVAYRYLPPYSPDFNPIEPAWAVFKTELRRIAARTVDQLEQALQPALDKVSAQHAAAYYKLCGYESQPC